MESNNYDLTLWNRLESRSRDKDLVKTLRAEVRDGIWMLCRQWQFGEFEAEDSGAPVSARINWSTQNIKTIALNGNPSEPVRADIPMEAEVERVEAIPDFYMRIEMGRHWMRLLQHKLPDSKKSQVIEAIKGNVQYRFVAIPEETKEDQYDNGYLLANEAMLRFLDAARYGKMVDGQIILEKIKQGVTVSALAGIPEDPAVNEVGAMYLEWFKRRYSQPESVKTDAWRPERLEYNFSVTAADNGGGDVVLDAAEYFQGRLDWYSFDMASEKKADKPEKIHSKHFIPAEIEFSGMPKARWWEFEDRKMNFSAIEASINETAKIVMSEFAFLYSNDWFVLPFSVNAGSLVDIKDIVVTDCFGQRTKISHYNRADIAGNAKDPDWAFFKLDHKEKTNHGINRTLFIPPVVLDLQESKPLEEVHFTRDEMANFVWAIETIVPDGLGKGINGMDYAQQMKLYFEQLAGEQAQEPFDAGQAEVYYKMATTVPENWIPFIPVQKPGGGLVDIQFQRAAMPRVLPGFKPKRVRPVTRFLRFGLEEESRVPYFVCEEEIPRAGTIVQQTWQRARWHNGKIVLWLGYRKTNGRGEAASGLKFDQALAAE